MPKDAFQYIFRFCCDPDFNDREELDALKAYVKAARIDEVAVFANVQELNTGHMSLTEQERYLRLLQDTRAALSETGVGISINHWHSLMHADLGKRLRPEQDFRLMVDAEGQKAALCVCPLCPEWQRYIAQIYARYAELDLSILWIEDDFRLHNHSPLNWGGCFCEAHMTLYSARAGVKLQRGEFVEGILKPGTPHPYRRIWLDVSRDTMLEAAVNIAAAIRRVNPDCRIGLMSSDPQVHAAEGRDWPALLHTLAAGGPPVDRIHLPGYQESSAGSYLHGFNRVSMLTRAFLPAETEVYPELENFPYSLFSKSRRFTRFQLLSALPLKPAGMTIDLYDLNGNGIVWQDGYQDMLRETKDYLNRMTEGGFFAAEGRGVRVLVNARSAYSLHSQSGQKMEELYPQESFFAALLPALGIPYVYCATLDISGEVVAISGQLLRNYSAHEIEALFRHNFVILNGDAAWTLFDMGLGALAGLACVSWKAQDSGAFSYEEVGAKHFYAGRRRARASALLLSSDVLAVDYCATAAVHEYSAFYDSYRRRCCAGECLVNGRVFVYPFGRFSAEQPLPPMLLNAVRQELLADVLRVARPQFPRVRGRAYLEPYCYWKAGAWYLYLVNGSLDDVDSLIVELPAAPGPEVNGLMAGACVRQFDVCVYLSEGDRMCRLPAELKGGEVHIPILLAGLETALLVLDSELFQ